MTSPLHKHAVAARLNRFLHRRTMPKSIEGKPQAIADELDALVSVVARFAPQQQESLADWWPRFESDLGERNATRSWPSEGEVAASCKAVSGQTSLRPAEAADIDSGAIWARRIRESGPVADFAMYGRFAVDMIRRGLITEGDLTKWRSNLFFADKDVYGEAEALRREAERKAAHESAMILPGLSEPRQVKIPAVRHIPEAAE